MVLGQGGLPDQRRSALTEHGIEYNYVDRDQRLTTVQHISLLGSPAYL